MENIYTIASSSASTTYGNIMTFFKELLISNFSCNFFKEVYVSSEISYVNIRRRLGRNTINEMSKLEKPYMTINPQIQPPDGDMYLYDIPLTKNIDNLECGIQKNTLFPIIKNRDDMYTLTYKLNRDQIQFEMSIAVSTLIKQLDLYKYMLNHFVWNRPFTVKTSLESMIPREIVKHMGILSNINIDDRKSNQTPVMLQMMNRHSVYPITYKMRNGTALDEFFMYYTADVLVTYNDLSIDTVNRKGMEDDEFHITFRATVDFNLPGMYALVGDKPKPKEIAIDLKSKNNDSSYDLIPMYTVNNLYARYSSTRNGFMMYVTTRFKTERDKVTKKDSLNIGVLFEEPYVEVMNIFSANNVPLKTLLEIILLKDGVELNEGTDWNLKESTLDLIINNANDDATYCIVIYVNNNLFTEHMTNIIEDKRTDKASI